MKSKPTTQYALDNSWQLARQRLAMLEAWFVPGTIQHLARVAILQGGMPGAEAWRLTYEQLRGELVASGEMGESEVDETLALLSDTEFTFISQILMAAWARRPEA